MSRKIEVRRLCDLTLHQLSALMIRALAKANDSLDSESQLPVSMASIKEYLEEMGTTANIYQDLVQYIMSLLEVEAKLRLLSLQMLLNTGVYHLTTHSIPAYHERWLLEVIAQQGTGLRVLDMKGTWVSDEHLHLMYEVVKNCIHLTKLHIPQIANDELLEEIAYFSRDLQVLDISGEIDVTDIGIEFLSYGICRERLTVLDIGVPGQENVCHSDIAILLVNCPNLETLGTYGYTGRALHYIHEIINSEFECKLKYVHDTCTHSDTLHSILKLCPRLKSLFLEEPRPGILQQLGTTRLIKLKLQKFSSFELMELLPCIGIHLRQITLIMSSEVLRLARLFNLCPSLTELKCYKMEKLTFSCNEYNGHFLDTLQDIELMHSFISIIDLKSLLCHSLNLRRLSLDHVDFTDDDMLDVFSDHDFDKIISLWFTVAPNLSVESVQLLIEDCPKLELVGLLSNWNMSNDDIIYLRALLKSGNCAMILSPIGFFS